MKKVLILLAFTTLISCSNSKRISTPNIPIIQQTENITNSQDLEGCEKNNTGDYCFSNATNKEIVIYYYYFEAMGARQISNPIIIKPGQNKCAYNLDCRIIYSFSAFIKPTQQELGQYSLDFYLMIGSIAPSPYDSGNLKVIKCKSKSYTVN